MKKSKTVLFLTPSVRLLGARQSLLELVGRLEAPWIPHVICSGHGGLEAELGRLGIRRSVIPHYAWRKGRYLVARYAQAWRISGEYARHRPALVHCNEFHCLPQALAAARMYRWRTRELPPPVTVHVRLGIYSRQIINYNLHKASRIVVVSRAVAALFDAFPALADRIRIVYNGVDLSRYSPSPPEERARARAALGLRESDVVVGLAGLLSPRKCQHIALEAVRRLSASCPNLVLLFAGEGFQSSMDYAERLRREASADAMQSRVHFLGFRETMREVYAAMDLNLLISNEEGFGRTIIEAGAMGIASVGTHVGGIPELIETDRTGALIPADNADALCNMLNALYNNTNLLREWGAAAARRVRECFSIEAHVRAMTAVWEEVVRENPQPRR